MASDPHAIPYGAPWNEWAEWVTEMPISAQLGIRCSEVSQGRVVLEFDNPDWLNPTGAVHGGIVIACADQGFGAAAATVMEEGSVPATATFTSDFLRPAFPPLTFEAVVDRLGKTLVFVSVTVRDQSGKVCNQARGTLSVNGSSRLTESLKSSGT
jgi:uncharacterized protein (TIGR00369 family)